MRNILCSLIVLVLILMALAACQPHQYTGTLLDPPKPINDFTIQADDGGEFRFSDLEDRLLVLYFGYTHCPDICPTTLYDIRQAMQKLGDDADHIQVMMITVDPERDTPDRLHEYMDNFDPAYVGLYEPDPDKLAEILANFGVFAEKNPLAEADANYLVSHSSHIFVVDQTGLRLLFSYGTLSDAIAADLRDLLR